MVPSQQEGNFWKASQASKIHLIARTDMSLIFSSWKMRCWEAEKKNIKMCSSKDFLCNKLDYLILISKACYRMWNLIHVYEKHIHHHVHQNLITKVDHFRQLNNKPCPQSASPNIDFNLILVFFRQPFPFAIQWGDLTKPPNQGIQVFINMFRPC